MKEKLNEYRDKYFQYDCELGKSNTETRVARAAYFAGINCRAEAINEVLDILREVSSPVGYKSVEDWLTDIRKRLN